MCLKLPFETGVLEGSFVILALRLGGLPTGFLVAGGLACIKTRASPLIYIFLKQYYGYVSHHGHNSNPTSHVFNGCEALLLGLPLCCTLLSASSFGLSHPPLSPVLPHSCLTCSRSPVTHPRPPPSSPTIITHRRWPSSHHHLAHVSCIQGHPVHLTVSPMHLAHLIRSQLGLAPHVCFSPVHPAHLPMSPP